MVGIVPMGQQLNVLGLHFYLFRILLLLGMVRVYVRGEFAALKWTKIDRYFAWWVVVSVIFGSLSKPSVALFINRLGDAFNAAGCYYFVRCVVVDRDDIIISVRALAWVSVPVAILMLIEKVTAHNYLSVFGGVPELTSVRDGSLRCQGAFRHPILAGCFGATQFPLFVALWFYGRPHRMLALVGCLAALAITVAASSSGALIGLMAAFLGLGLWKFRTKMRMIRWAVVLTIVALAMVMKQPVWYLISDLSGLIGGGGWHRSFLIGQAVKYFNEWWLFGTTYTAHWGPAGEVIAADPNMMDITNHYIMEGVKGGILKLGLFVAIIVLCFKAIGRSVRAEPPGAPVAFLYWAFGVSLFAHCLSFISITYFDQLIIIWFWLLATICQIPAIPVTEEAGSEAAPSGEGASQDNPRFEFQP